MRRFILKKALIGMFITLAPLGLTLQAAEKVHLSLWENDNADISNEMKKWVTVFSKSNPNISVDILHYETEELRTKFLRSAITGDGADLIYGPNDMAGVFAMAGVIQPLNGMFQEDKFNKETLEISTLDGKLWGIPVSEGNHLMLVYNKKFIKKAPESTDELIEMAKKFVDPAKNKYGLAMFQAEPFWFAPILHGFGGSALDKKNGKVNVTLDTPEMQKAVQFLVDLKNKHGILPKECNYDCAKSMFLAENAPFYIIGDWEISNLRSKLGKDLGIAALPMVSESKKRMSPMLSGRFIFINKSAKGAKLDAVKKFIDFIISNKIQQRLATNLGRIPAIKEAKNSAETQKLTELNELIQAAAYPTPMPAEVEMRAAWDGMRIMLQRAMTGDQTVAQAIKTGQKTADEALKTLKKEM